MPEFLLDGLSGSGAEAALFASAFISATLMPGGSEALLAGALLQTPDDSARICRLVLLATTGNTLGAMTSWLIGRLIPEREKAGRALVWLRRWGVPALLFSWLPVVGDALPLAAGWLRMPVAASVLWIAAGKLLRYLVIAAGTLSLI